MTFQAGNANTTLDVDLWNQAESKLPNDSIYCLAQVPHLQRRDYDKCQAHLIKEQHICEREADNGSLVDEVH